MAIKRMQSENCWYCGKKMATLLPDGSVKVDGHTCEEGPPGLAPYPYTFRPNEVVFIPAVLNVLTRVRDGNGRVMLLFNCPGCKGPHSLVTKAGKYPSPTWTFNGDMVKPTFKPSLMVNRSCPDQCHSFITDGKIQFLGDCKHELAGQTVDMEPWDREPEEET